VSTAEPEAAYPRPSLYAARAVRQEALPVPYSLPDTMNSSSEPAPVCAADVVIPSDPAEARRVQDQIEQVLQGCAAHDHDVFSIKLALEEALVNAIKHGNQMDRSKKVQISYRLHIDRFEIHITDEGPGFDPAEVPDPTAFENLERPCGRGLMLMRHYMTEVAFHGRGNTVSMKKHFGSNGKK
jgi:serine/threonine-protein kinase RsbW